MEKSLNINYEIKETQFSIPKNLNLFHVLFFFWHFTDLCKTPITTFLSNPCRQPWNYQLPCCNRYNLWNNISQTQVKYELRQFLHTRVFKIHGYSGIPVRVTCRGLLWWWLVFGRGFDVSFDWAYTINFPWWKNRVSQNWLLSIV